MAFIVYGQDNDSYAFREYPALTEEHVPTIVEG